MIDSELYPTIFKRKSIRKFIQEPLAKSTIQELNHQISHIEPLFENIKTEIAVLAENDIGGIFQSKPHTT